MTTVWVSAATVLPGNWEFCHGREWQWGWGTVDGNRWQYHNQRQEIVIDLIDRLPTKCHDRHPSARRWWLAKMQMSWTCRDIGKSNFRQSPASLLQPWRLPFLNPINTAVQNTSSSRAWTMIICSSSSLKPVSHRKMMMAGAPLPSVATHAGYRGKRSKPKASGNPPFKGVVLYFSFTSFSGSNPMKANTERQPDI